MISFEQMLIRLLAAFALGALIGLEREMAGKEAGIRTTMLVTEGACVFTIISISLPYIINPQSALEMLTVNGGYLNLIANIVIGIGFLGAGIILKTSEHVHGLTTAAVVWAAAAVGTLVGLGLLKFALVSALFISIPLYFLRKIRIAERVRPKNGNWNGNGE